jgi:hypothetical protein
MGLVGNPRLKGEVYHATLELFVFKCLSGVRTTLEENHGALRDFKSLFAENFGEFLGRG